MEKYVYKLLDKIIEQILLSENNQYHGILDGTAGETMLLVKANYLIKQNQFEDIITEKIGIISDALQNNLIQINAQSTFYSGNAGIIWFLKYMQNEYEYEIDEESISFMDNYCLSKAKYKFLQGHFDFFTGGIGYSLPILKNKSAVTTCKEYSVLSVLAHLQCVSMSKQNACPVLAHKQHVSIHNIAEFN
jgi:hypothetical protein